jgi:hypothetical protein
MGMRPDVFAKIGDSITESASFLSDIGQGWYVLGRYGALEPTIAHFRADALRRREQLPQRSERLRDGRLGGRATRSPWSR